MKTYPSFMAACKDFFGMKPGQTSVDFLKEVKELTPQDREQMTGYFADIGVTIEKQ